MLNERQVTGFMGGVGLGRKRGPFEAPLRTREHVLGDLAVNHVERQVLLCSWSVQELLRDYGFDLVLFAFSQNGEMENGFIFLQVKGTERLTWAQGNDVAPFRITRANLVGWLAQYSPVILIVYEATTDRAYWIHIQSYFAAIPNFNLFEIGATYTVQLPRSQVFTPGGVRQIGILRHPN